jgi:DNA-binding MarR family transcriptional regulator
MPLSSGQWQPGENIDVHYYYGYYLIVKGKRILAGDGRTMEKTPFLDEYYRLWLLLAGTRSAIFKVRHKKGGQYLHPNQAAALVSIWAYKGRATPAALARRLFLEPNSVSELIMRMEKKGLVAKSRDRKKGNIVRVSITKKGREVCRQVMGRDLIRRIMSSLSGEQREQLAKYLLVLYREALKELGVGEDMPLLT